jgi:hypothetical protein
MNTAQNISLHSESQDKRFHMELQFSERERELCPNMCRPSSAIGRKEGNRLNLLSLERMNPRLDTTTAEKE